MCIQWNLRIKDTLRAGLSSFIWRLSSRGRLASHTLYSTIVISIGATASVLCPTEVVLWWEGPCYNYFFFFYVHLQVPQSTLTLELARSILSEYKIHNADITLRCDATADDLIDVIEGNRYREKILVHTRTVNYLQHLIKIMSDYSCRIYIPCIYLLNKIDQISVEELDIIYRIPHAVPISAHHKWNFDDLLEKMWDYLSLVRMWAPSPLLSLSLPPYHSISKQLATMQF